MHSKLIEDSIVFGVTGQAEKHLTELTACIVDAICIYPEEQAALERTLSLSRDRVTGINAPTKPLPIRGIENTSNHCPDNAIAQLLAGAPNFLSKLPQLKLIQFEMENATTLVVDSSFGPNFRQFLGSLLTDKDREDWLKENGFSSQTQVDVLAPLSSIIDKAGQTIQFKKYTTAREITFENGTETAQEMTFESGEKKDAMIHLDMSRDESFRDESFMDKFENTFQQYTYGGAEKESFKFIDAPSDLVIAANRQVHAFNNSQQKKSTSIQDVPQVLSVKPELTVNNQGAKYEITGCIIHGGTDNSGHYTALRKVGDTWYYINDSVVEEVPNPQDYLSKGYVFHYQKVEYETAEESTFTCYDILKSIWASVWKPFQTIDEEARSKKDV